MGAWGSDGLKIPGVCFHPKFTAVWIRDRKDRYPLT